MSNLRGGINRLIGDASEGQAVEALNVTGDDGDVRRRHGLASIATAAPHRFPRGQDRIAVATGGSPSIVSTTSFAVGATTTQVYFGNILNQFNGFDWAVDSWSGAIAEHVELVLEYWNGSAWVAFAWVFDDTIEFASGYIQTLGKTGRVAWHIPSDWATTTVASVSAYWVRGTFRNPFTAATGALLDGSREIARRDTGTFQLAPVNGIFPVRIEQQTSLIACADRITTRGFERGAQLGIRQAKFERTQVMRFILDEGPFIASSFAWEDWAGGAGAIPTVTLDLRKTLQQLFVEGAQVNYDWMADQFLGALFFRAQIPSAVTINSVDGVSDGTEPEGYFEHARLRLRTSTAAPPAAGEDREVYSSGLGAADRLSVFPDFSDIPALADTFDLRGPPAKLVVLETGSDWDVYANTADDVDLSFDGNVLERDLADLDDSPSGHFQIYHEPRWMLRSGHRWSGASDPVTGRFLLTNGDGILECDGRSLRVLKADTTSLTAQRYSGALVDDTVLDTPADPKAIALSKLRREPPRGKYLTIFHNRIFVAGMESSPYNIVYSAPGGINNIWPFLFETMVRDPEQDPISGMAVAGENLYAFTPSAIHMAGEPTADGMFTFLPIKTGVGFTAHAGVCVTQDQTVLGVTPDGIGALQGAAFSQLLDRWDRVLEGGVNQSRLDGAVACYLAQSNRAFFAVPATGSQVNNRLVEVDFARKAVWLHSLSFGCSFLSVDYDETGQEQLLLGTDDGFIQTFRDQLLDDGVAVTGSVVTPPIGLEDELFSVRLVRVCAGLLGSQAAITARVLGGEEADKALVSGSMYFDNGGLTLGIGDLSSTDDDARMAGRNEVRWMELRCRDVRVHRLSVSLESTAQFRIRGVFASVVPVQSKGRP